jgi:hypothetical protein
MHNNNCRVCGFDYGSPPWGDDGQTPLWEYCPCCGTEFGYQDSTYAGVKRKRKEWIDGGKKWLIESEKPHDWSFDKQIKNIPENYK